MDRDVTVTYLSLSATLARPAFAHAASLSPPGAPLTDTAPISWLPTLIGTPPWKLAVPGRIGGGTGAPGGRLAGGPDGFPNAITLLIFMRPISIDALFVPSSRRNALSMFA